MKGRFPWLDVAIEWSEDVALIRKRQHTTDDLVNLVDAIAASAESRGRSAVPAWYAPPASSAAARRRVPMSQDIFEKRVVCVHPFAGNESEAVATGDFFGMLIDQLVEAEEVHVILIGTPDESELGASILESVANAPSVWSLIGRVALDDLAALIARCSLFVGNDSGPKHIAAALGIPTVGIHSGVVDAREWGPRGIKRHCHSSGR